ncbi:MAG: hypothetical protein HRU28_12960 [Rhizobiales bacterium]|nr:hypothetical protein [Hyphomicrobiales bacterium]
MGTTSNVIQTKGYRGIFIHPDAIANSQIDFNAWVNSQINDLIIICRNAGATDSEIRIAFSNAMKN